MILTKKEVVGTLLLDDCISQEEAKLLLSKESDDFDKEGDRVEVVAELLFGRLINPNEASALLDPENHDLNDMPDFDAMFSTEHRPSDLVDFQGRIIKVKYSFIPINFQKPEPV